LHRILSKTSIIANEDSTGFQEHGIGLGAGELDTLRGIRARKSCPKECRQPRTVLDGPQARPRGDHQEPPVECLVWPKPRRPFPVERSAFQLLQRCAFRAQCFMVFRSKDLLESLSITWVVAIQDSMGFWMPGLITP